MKDTVIFVKSVTCTQDMLYAMRVLVVLGLKVELPMVLEIDNKGTVNPSK